VYLDGRVQCRVLEADSELQFAEELRRRR